MGRYLRLIDSVGGVVEVTFRTVQGRYLMRPSSQVNDIILGVLGRAQAKFPVELFAFVFLSNHAHILMRVESAERMAEFTGFLKSNLAKELGRIYDWREKFWAKRYHSASVADSEKIQTERFLYLLKNSCKENLVASPLEWPGVSSAAALYRGEMTMTGTWYNRTAEYRARQRGKRKLFPSTETVYLSPLPFLEHCSAKEQREFVVNAVRQVEEETRARHQQERTRPLGARRVRRQNPHAKPKSFEPSPGKLFHYSTNEELLAMRTARDMTEAAYRDAAKRLRRGEADVRFPQGTFPPPAPFVPMRAPP